MTETTLAELIARLEKATGPDPKLDVQIAFAIGWRAEEWPEDGRGPMGTWRPPPPHGCDWDALWTSWLWTMPDGSRAVLRDRLFTASLDAALTLVPQGKEWEMYGYEPLARIYYAGSKYVDGRAATPALALCIAALRASEVTQ